MKIFKNLSQVSFKKYYGNRPIRSNVEFILPSFLVEGLIKTYPEAKVIHILSTKYDLQVFGREPINNQDFFKLYDEKNYSGAIWIEHSKSSPECIRIRSAVFRGEYNKDTLDSEFSRCEYFNIPSGMQIYSNSYFRLENEPNLFLISYIYEKKFDIDVTEKVLSNQYLYHICRSKVVPKILHIGLTPRTSEKWNNFTNPERIYFFSKKLSDQNFKSWAKNFADEKNEDKDIQYSLLQIDIKNINEKFYMDPRMEGGVYCNNSISPERIKEIATILV